MDTASIVSDAASLAASDIYKKRSAACLTVERPLLPTISSLERKLLLAPTGKVGRGQLRFNAELLAEGSGLDLATYQRLAQDGTHMSKLIEVRLAHDYGIIKTPSNQPFDVQDERQRPWELRCLTNHGTHFAPSSMHGGGRVFDEVGFQARLDLLYGFILCDLVAFPTVELYAIRAYHVRAWWKAGLLGSGTRTGYAQIHQLMIKL
jgi:hypothetical protein